MLIEKYVYWGPSKNRFTNYIHTHIDLQMNTHDFK